MKCVLILLCLYVLGNTATPDIYINKETLYNSTHELSYLQNIKEDLGHRDWQSDEEPCKRQLIRIVENVQNSTLWATWIWDSMQQPVGQLYGSAVHLGNYDQCLDLPWDQHPELRTQYCLAELKVSELDDGIKNVDLFGPVQRYLKSKTRHSLTYNRFAWGVCVPAVCKAESVAKFVEILLRRSHLGLSVNRLNVSVNPEYCQVSGQAVEGPPGFYGVLSFIALLTVVTLLCSYYGNSKRMQSTVIGMRIAKAFNIKSNMDSLTKNSEDHLRSLLGIRFISSFVTTGGHYWLLKVFFGLHNAGKLDKLYGTTPMAMVFNIEMMIDTFIMISGLLLINGLMQNGVKPFSPWKVIAKRYIRFMWPILVTLMVLPYAYSPSHPGPLGRRFFKDGLEFTRNHWWKVVLMIANYSDPEKICYPVLWSVSCDFHLSVMGILIYWIYVKDRRSGLKVFAACAAAALFMPFVYAYVNGTAAVKAFDFRMSFNYRKYIIIPPYIWSNLRAGAYFVGMAVGYLFAVYKPARYRNVISKRASILAFCVFLVLFGLLNVVTYKYQWKECGDLERSLFTVLRRIFWAALVAFLIIICEYGTLPLIPDFLSWSVLVPFCKLSYGVYLTHFAILERYLSETRVPVRQDIFDDFIVTGGVYAISMVLSLFMWIFLEAPIINLLYIPFSRSKSTQNGDIVSHKQQEKNAEKDEKKIS